LEHKNTKTVHLNNSALVSVRQKGRDHIDRITQSGG